MMEVTTRMGRKNSVWRKMNGGGLSRSSVDGYQLENQITFVWVLERPSPGAMRV
jgi:hypothetical protein